MSAMPRAGPGRAPPRGSGWRILRETRTVAIVGASRQPGARQLLRRDLPAVASAYEVYFVNPRATEILGRPVYPSLADLPVVPDLVDVFRRHEDLPAVLDETSPLGGRRSGCSSASGTRTSAATARRRASTVVMDRCLKIEHARFHGGLHLAGFDTGVITSRRRS